MKPKPIPFEAITSNNELTLNQSARLVYSLMGDGPGRTEDELERDFSVVREEIHAAQIFLELMNLVMLGKIQFDVDHSQSGQSRIRFSSKEVNGLLSDPAFGAPQI